MRLREWQKKALLCAASSALVLGVGEVVARLLWGPGSEASVIRADPLCGWSLRPGSHLHSVDSDRGLDYHIEVNSVGLRDRERTRGKPAGLRRVLFVGDSMVFGTGIEMGARCSDRLESLLGPGVEVLNAGVGGWGTDQEYLWLCDRGFDFHPDVVVLGLCVANDILNNMLPHELFGTAPKPRFDLHDGRLVLEPASARPAPPVSQRLRRVLRHSRLLYFVGRHLQELRDSRGAPEPAPKPGPPPYFPEDFEADISHWSVFRRQYTPRFESAFRVTETVIAAMQESCAARDVPFVLFAFPQKVEVDPAARESELHHYGYDPPQFDLAAPYARLGTLAGRLGVPYVYPVEAFREAAQRERIYFARDGHLNAAGQVLAAQSLESAVRDALDRAGSAAVTAHRGHGS